MSFAPTAATRGEAPGSYATRELVGPARPGRRFQPVAERLLDDDLARLASRLPHASDGLAFVREFSGARGVADAVAVTGWQGALSERLALDLPFLVNETDCSIVAALSPKQPRALPSLSIKLGMSEEQLERRLRSLSARGYVESRRAGYSRERALVPIGRAYALEAKVSDWRQGISQALRYATWCDAAAVVLPKDPRNLDVAKARCSKLGIGLASNGRWVVRPRIGRPNPGLRLSAAEKFAQQAVASPAF